MATPMSNRTEKQKRAYRDCGLIMEKLAKLGLRVRWDKPLATNIYQQVRARIGSETLSSTRLNAALRHHVKSPTYLLRLVEGAQRYSIQGRPSSIVTKEEYHRAVEELQVHHSSLMRERRKRRNKVLYSTPRNQNG